jgi:hypothetical protein
VSAGGPFQVRFGRSQRGTAEPLLEEPEEELELAAPLELEEPDELELLVPLDPLDPLDDEDELPPMDVLVLTALVLPLLEDPAGLEPPDPELFPAAEVVDLELPDEPLELLVVPLLLEELVPSGTVDEDELDTTVTEPLTGQPVPAARHKPQTAVRVVRLKRPHHRLPLPPETTPARIDIPGVDP